MFISLQKKPLKKVKLNPWGEGTSKFLFALCSQLLPRTGSVILHTERLETPVHSENIFHFQIASTG